MPSEGAIRVEGLREFSRALAWASPQARKELKTTLQQVAEPIRHQVQTLAVQNISHLRAQRGRGRSHWDVARIGVTQNEVYIVPREKGARKHGGRGRRPRFGQLLMDRAYDPALEHNRVSVERSVEQMLTLLAERINRA